MQTQAAVLVEPLRPLRTMTLSVPELRPGQVLVEVAYSGICHSQLLEVRGQRGEDRFLPHTLGHEGAGTVRQVGEGVTKVKPGDRVVLSWIKGQGAEVPSTVYGSAEGAVNSGAVSTFMRDAVVSENRLTPIPTAMPLREAALLGCAVPTGVGAVLNTAGIGAGAGVAVFGLGGIGLSAVLGARLAEAATIIGVDIVGWKLEWARRAGATHLIDAGESDPLAAIMELSGGRGVDFAIETAGRPETMETAFRAVRERGGLCVVAGNLRQGERISIDPFDLIRGRRIVGTWGGGTEPDRDIPRYVDHYLAGRLPLELLITHEYPLEDIDAALDALERGEVGRGLVALGA